MVLIWKKKSATGHFLNYKTNLWKYSSYNKYIGTNLKIPNVII